MTERLRPHTPITKKRYERARAIIAERLPGSANRGARSQIERAMRAVWAWQELGTLDLHLGSVADQAVVEDVLDVLHGVVDA